MTYEALGRPQLPLTSALGIQQRMRMLKIRSTESIFAKRGSRFVNMLYVANFHAMHQQQLSRCMHGLVQDLGGSYISSKYSWLCHKSQRSELFLGHFSFCFQLILRSQLDACTESAGHWASLPCSPSALRKPISHQLKYISHFFIRKPNPKH